MGDFVSFMKLYIEEGAIFLKISERLRCEVKEKSLRDSDSLYRLG